VCILFYEQKQYTIASKIKQGIFLLFFIFIFANHPSVTVFFLVYVKDILPPIVTLFIKRRKKL